MDVFTIRDLRERTGKLVRDAEGGRLSLVTKRGRSVFLAVPFDETVVQVGVAPALAAKLFADGTLTLAQGARLAGDTVEGFIELLGALGVPAVDYPPDELDGELDALG